jgi:hypothetical protein
MLKIAIAPLFGALWVLQALNPAPALAYEPIPRCWTEPAPDPRCLVDCFDWNDEYPDGCFKPSPWRECDVRPVQE